MVFLEMFQRNGSIRRPRRISQTYKNTRHITFTNLYHELYIPSELMGPLSMFFSKEHFSLNTILSSCPEILLFHCCVAIACFVLFYVNEL